MYKVIIADDEVWIGFGIKKLIHRSGLPFEVVGEAANGIQAYDMVKKWKPDLLITDIRMPGLDGLALMRRLMEEKESVKVIFISGYAEFEYAREALRMGAFDFCLKPVEEEALQTILQQYVDRQKTQEKPAARFDVEIKDSRIRGIMEEIDRRYRHKISLGELADSCNMSIGHLSTLIKKETGVSFSEYVTQKRMEDAKGLLRDDSLSVDEIAQMVGYSDYFYFIKAFKKYAGISPSAYRRQV